MLVYILPLRNENAVIHTSPPDIFQCLYPTFKEWKLQPRCFERIKSQSLYPTFKEWKPGSKKKWYHTVPRVYILPLRNENYDRAMVPLR